MFLFLFKNFNQLLHSSLLKVILSYDIKAILLPMTWHKTFFFLFYCLENIRNSAKARISIFHENMPFYVHFVLSSENFRSVPHYMFRFFSSPSVIMDNSQLFNYYQLMKVYLFVFSIFCSFVLGKIIQIFPLL